MKIWEILKRFLATLGLILLGIVLIAIAVAAIYAVGCLLLFVGEMLKGAAEWTIHWAIAHWGVIAIIVLLIAAVAYAVGETARSTIAEKWEARKAKKAKKNP